MASASSRPPRASRPSLTASRAPVPENSILGLSTNALRSSGRTFFRFIRFMGTHDLTLGVNNVLDREPPLVGDWQSNQANTIAGFYDTLGRFVFANVTFRW